MKMKSLAILLALSLLSGWLYGQKKILGPEVYNDWKKIGDVSLSNNGKFAAYTIKPHRGDGFLYLVNIETGEKDSVARGVEPVFSDNSGFLIFKITPVFDTLRNMELRKVAKDKMPKNNLAVWDLAKDSIVKYGEIKDYQLAQKGTILAFTGNKNEWPKNFLSKKQVKQEAKNEKKHGKRKTDGKLLTVVDLTTGRKNYFRHITGYQLAPSGSYLVIQEQEKLKKDSIHLHVYNTADLKKSLYKLPKRTHAIANVVFNEGETAFVFMQSSDTNITKWWSLMEYRFADNSMRLILDSSKHYSNNLALSSNFVPFYKNKDQNLFFGIGGKPEPNKKDSLLESEKYKLDLWHWKDDRIQPQQLVELKRDERKSYPCMLDLATGKFVELGNDTLSVYLNRNVGEKQYSAMATSDKRYRFKSWESPTADDYYLIDFNTGKLTMLQEAGYSRATLSLSSKYFVFWNEKTKNYYLMNTETHKESCVTCSYNGSIFEDLNGMPMMDQPMGILGFDQQEKGLLIQAKSNLLYYQIETEALVSLVESLKTGSANIDTNQVYNLQKMNSDSSYYVPTFSLLTKFDRKSKIMSVYRLKGAFPAISYELISGSYHDYGGFKMDKNGGRVLMQRNSNADYPDLFATTKAGSDIKRLSNTNPQQAEYNWSTVELINWTSYSGVPLQGLLYKPENFDTNQTYPLLVYYYELYSDEIHNHYAPKPTASIIFPTEYASAGYVVFIPDVRYKPGHPADGAYDCILSGTDAVLKKYSNIDSKRMGLQGQSWGGYQTAQLITMTDRFAAAMAGAPVGNMFSAYGGIRWGSGYSRQFQYEHTQSRIGKTIWEAPELYIENSPVFHLPKVKTPLMIMHNDEDGAVPWYQGIELYTGLRRLQKPVWLLNYNGDDHNLMKNANRIDLSIRMRQFFDYYLLGKPAPRWLIEGIPAIDKGKKNYYELTE